MVARIVPSDTLKASPQGEGFKVSSTLIPAASVFQTVTSLVLPLSSVVQPYQRQWQLPILIEESLRHPWSAIQKEISNTSHWECCQFMTL